MKLNLILLALILSFTVACNTSKQQMSTNNLDSNTSNDTLKISNDSLKYEIIIIEPGFNFWLKSVAKPEGFYSQNYLENKNIRYVTEWNNRVAQPQRYNPNLYELQINYQIGIDYGYDVNYKLYNYFIYFQNTYKQNLLGGIVPIN